MDHWYGLTIGVICSLLIETLQLLPYAIFPNVRFIGIEIFMILLFVQNFELLCRRFQMKWTYIAHFRTQSVNPFESYCVLLHSHTSWRDCREENIWHHLLAVCLLDIFSKVLNRERKIRLQRREYMIPFKGSTFIRNFLQNSKPWEENKFREWFYFWNCDCSWVFKSQTISTKIRSGSFHILEILVSKFHDDRITNASSVK